MASLLDAARRLREKLAGDDAEKLRVQGNGLLAQGLPHEAVDCYRRLVELRPGDAASHLNLGYALQEVGELVAAEASFRQALACDSAIDDGWYMLGTVLVQLGRKQEAEQALRQALVAKPDLEFAYRDLGYLLEEAGQLQQAFECHRAAIGANPRFGDSLAAGARLLLALGRPLQALDWADRAIAVQGAGPQQLMQKATALHALGRDGEAIHSLVPAMRALESDPQACYLHGGLLFATGQLAGAAESYGRALELRPGWVDAASNRGVALLCLGQRDQAAQAFRQALEVLPGHRHASYHLGFILQGEGRHEEAIQVYETALQSHPADGDLHVAKGLAQLLVGQFEQGWREHEWRWRAPVLGHGLQRPLVHGPQWAGNESLDNRSILITHEQGLGDSIQFMRYIPLLLEQGAKVHVQLPAALEPLVGWQGAVLVRSGNEPPNCDFHCPMLSLPLAFGTTSTTIPADIPYIRSDAMLRRFWEEKLGPRRGLRVGLVWSGSATHNNDANRSIALSRVLEGASAAIQWVSLQKEVRAEDLPALSNSDRLFHAGDMLSTFAETAALTDCMDVVVSVDTSVAHLAGALGKRLWLLLPFAPDWRWLLDRSDSPWYPTARLFRQDADRDWDAVLLRVRRELDRLNTELAS